VLVSYIHTHFMLDVDINDNWYIMYFLEFAERNMEFTLLVLKLAYSRYFSHSQWILTTQRMNSRHYGNRNTVNPYQGYNSIINSLSVMIGSEVILCSWKNRMGHRFPTSWKATIGCEGLNMESSERSVKIVIDFVSEFLYCLAKWSVLISLAD